jgi:RNA polymerase sigma-70 factor (ECF subfamily)
MSGCVTLPNILNWDTPPDLDLAKLRQKLRYRAAHEVSFACPDLDDIVQESLRRFLEASLSDKVRSLEVAGAFLNGICRNVISEYRRRLLRDGPMPECIAEPPDRALPGPERFELRQAIEEAMQHLSERDRTVLKYFYLEECATEEILERTGLTLENFRVVLCRAKERFREIYSRRLQYHAGSSH